MITKNRRVLSVTNAYISSFAAAVGKKEGEGPLGNEFDLVCTDTTLGQDSWELAESALISDAINICLSKSDISASQIDVIFHGDLLDQCMGSSLAIKKLGIPSLGLYGACSTMAESLLLASCAVASGMSLYSLAAAESHFCSSERQFRFPLGYGGQRTPTSQWTVTGAGAVIVSSAKSNICVRDLLIGRMIDLGVTDANNMGAAMSPAAHDTFVSYFNDTGTSPADYDLIVTGDLGKVGSDIFKDMMRTSGFDMGTAYNDCGVLIFDSKEQDTHAGGSGCGCSASVLCGYILPRIKSGQLKNVLFCATGALLSPTSSQQGASIPGIAHLVHMVYEE